ILAVICAPGRSTLASMPVRCARAATMSSTSLSCAGTNELPASTSSFVPASEPDGLLDVAGGAEAGWLPGAAVAAAAGLVGAAAPAGACVGAGGAAVGAPAWPHAAKTGPAATAAAQHRSERRVNTDTGAFSRPKLMCILPAVGRYAASILAGSRVSTGGSAGTLRPGRRTSPRSVGDDRRGDAPCDHPRGAPPWPPPRGTGAGGQVRRQSHPHP